MIVRLLQKSQRRISGSSGKNRWMTGKNSMKKTAIVRSVCNPGWKQCGKMRGMPMNEIIGKIAVIDLTKRHMVIMDKDQILHPYTCAEPLDMILQEQKVGYFVKVTLDGDICKKIEYAPRPSDWPFQKGGGKPFIPRNDRLMSLLSMCKLGEGVFAITTTPDQMDFDTAMDLIISRAIKDTDTIMKAGEQK
jgi:hypothetical protein